MEISVKYLPIITVCLLVLTIIFRLIYVIFYGKGIISSLPCINDTESKSPESSLFGQALNISWLLLSFTIYVKYRQVKDILNRYNIDNKKVLNRTAMQIGIAAAFAVSIVANFQQTNLFYVIYLCGLTLAFGFGAVYQCLQSFLYMNLRKILGQRKMTSLRIILSVISTTTFTVFFVGTVIVYKQKKDENYLCWFDEDHGFILYANMIFEGICVASSLSYVILFHWEFKKIALYEPDVFVEDKITTDLNMERTNEGFDGT